MLRLLRVAIARSTPSRRLSTDAEFRRDALEGLLRTGFAVDEAATIYDTIESQLNANLATLSSQDQLKTAVTVLEARMATTASFALSNSPFSSPVGGQNGAFTAAPSLVPIDPAALEREIQLTGQHLSDEIRQLQADMQLDANLDSKRDEEVDQALDAKLLDASAYVESKIVDFNDHLERGARQALVSIGGISGLFTCALQLIEWNTHEYRVYRDIGCCLCIIFAVFQMKEMIGATPLILIGPRGGPVTRDVASTRIKRNDRPGIKFASVT